MGAVVEQLRQAGWSYITATHDVRNLRSGLVMQRLGMTYRYSYQEQWQPKDIPVIFGCINRISMAETRPTKGIGSDIRSIS